MHWGDSLWKNLTMEIDYSDSVSETRTAEPFSALFVVQICLGGPGPKIQDRTQKALSVANNSANQGTVVQAVQADHNKNDYQNVVWDSYKISMELILVSQSNRIDAAVIMSDARMKRCWSDLILKFWLIAESWPLFSSRDGQHSFLCSLISAQTIEIRRDAESAESAMTQQWQSASD